MGLDDSESDPFENDTTDDSFSTETRKSRFCTVCGTTTTVTDGEVKFCGSCGRRLKNEHTWNRLSSGGKDKNPDGDIGI